MEMEREPVMATGPEMATALSQLSPRTGLVLIETSKDPVPPVAFCQQPIWSMYWFPETTANWIIDWKVLKLSSLQMSAEPAVGQPVPAYAAIFVSIAVLLIGETVA